MTSGRSVTRQVPCASHLSRLPPDGRRVFLRAETCSVHSACVHGGAGRGG